MKAPSHTRFALALLCVWLVMPAAAESARYASIRNDQAFLREGPSYAHKVLWVYRRRFYPVKVIGSFDAWRHVKDADGTVGWMHHTQLSDARSVLFIRRAIVHAEASPRSKIVAFAQAGVVARLKACKPQSCEVEADGVDGWVERINIWGVDIGEVIQ